MTDANRTKEQLISDLAEMRRRIAKLEGSERKYRLITEDSSEYISLLTLKGIYTYVSPSIRQLGYEPEELLGKSGLDMVHSDDRKRLIPLLTTYARMKIRDLLRLKKQNVFEQISFRFPNKSGRWHYMEATANLIDAPDGKGTDILLTSRDVTEHRRLQGELQESEARLRTILNSMPTGIMVIDAETHRIVDVNPMAVETFGAPREQIIGSVCHQYICPAEKGHCPIIDLGEIVDNAEQVLLNADGKSVPILKSVVSVMLNNRKHLIESFIDITERKEAEEALEEKSRELEAASRAKSEFLSGMSHEVRTPLNAVIGFSELMLDGVAGEINDEQRDCLSDILSSGQHLLTLINDILDLSKVEAGKMEFRLENLDLVDVISSTAPTVKPMLDDKKHTLEVSVEEGLPQVRADENRLRQILLNLLSNAIKFTPPGGKLAIKASRKGDWCQVRVIDNGLGIKKEDQERIFEVFTQAEALPDESRKGTGLGLTLTRQLVEAGGGRIWVESEYGKGSEFIFTLPLITK